ncbi:uncharacterized protein [Triticum aestivum]|uniref:uncharacterized protein n=1 Tax=Triticum aestivum TaxID=4565 RepID=UPI001D0275CE|nr:uncharacterized protein LOC123069746 [Triticum aestivum]
MTWHAPTHDPHSPTPNPHTHTNVGSHLSRLPRSPFSTLRRRQISAIPAVPHRPALLPEFTSPRSPYPPTGFSPRPGERRPGTGGGAPRGGPSGVELLLLQAQRHAREELRRDAARMGHGRRMETEAVGAESAEATGGVDNFPLDPVCSLPIFRSSRATVMMIGSRWHEGWVVVREIHRWLHMTAAVATGARKQRQRPYRVRRVGGQARSKDSMQDKEME